MEESITSEAGSRQVRSVLIVENKLYAEPQPVKMFYITPAFRYEKPESGRLRQHHQFGVEFVGSPNPMAEVEVMTLVSTLIRQIGLSALILFVPVP